MVQEDKEILKVVSETIQQLNIKDYTAVIVWTKARWPVSSDQPFVLRDRLLLPRTLMGKLEPEQWRPLIASSLLWGRKFRGKIRRRTITMALAAFALFLALLFPVVAIALVLAPLFKAPREPAVGAGVISSLVLPLILLRLVQSRWEIRLRLTADQIAGDLLGKEIFLQVLRKIDQMGLKDVETRERRRSSAHLIGRPSIVERINALEKPSTPPMTERYSWPDFIPSNKKSS